MSDSSSDINAGFGEHPDRSGPAQLDTVWSALVEDLPPNQRAWLAGSRPVTLHESTAIIAVADDFTRNQIEGRLRTRLEDALGALVRPPGPDRGHRRPRARRPDRADLPGDGRLGGPAYRGTGEYGGAPDAPEAATWTTTRTTRRRIHISICRQIPWTSRPRPRHRATGRSPAPAA